MTQPSQTVRDFISDCYQLVSANSPTVPLHGNDESKGIQFLNELISAYSANGLMLTVAKQVDFTVAIGQGEITFGQSDYTPTPDVTTEGRLANLENAWLTLENVTYPLVYEDRNDFFNSYYYSPLQGLPRFIIVKPQTNLTTVKIFPAPSQVYDLSIYGKWTLNSFTANDTMDTLPHYYIRYLRFAVARDLAVYKSRGNAWTEKLEAMFREAEKDMEATSSVNLDININQQSWLNGSWRVRSGI
ncbi:MAG: hypothetical protein KBC53_02735 [Nitrosomonas sp.]|nr:hypothetical protein [Nitrosomonas sp.]